MRPIADWLTDPAVLKGAVGSALFFFVLELTKRLVRAVGSSTSFVKAVFEREDLLREYVYRKYTSQPGLVYYPQGYFLTFDKALRFSLQGLIAACVSIALAPFWPVAAGIGLVAAIYFLMRALTWLYRKGTWEPSGMTKENWEWIKNFESTVQGKPAVDTLERLASFEERNRGDD